MTHQPLYLVSCYAGVSLHFDSSNLKKTRRRCGTVTEEKQDAEHNCQAQLEKSWQVTNETLDTRGEFLTTTFSSSGTLGGGA
jgi:hypothetical protein